MYMYVYLYVCLYVAMYVPTHNVCTHVPVGPRVCVCARWHACDACVRGCVCVCVSLRVCAYVFTKGVSWQLLLVCLDYCLL